jgi:HD-like signal output (HDOD) protein
MMKKILFVDNQSNIQGGLRRMLHPLQEEWAAEVAESGAQALAVLAREPFDVVVSDMRLPGMTGAQLLEHIRGLFPKMVRILIASESSDGSGMEALHVAHQILDRPCDAEILKAAIARVSAVMALVANPKQQAIVTRQGSLPTLPSLYREILAELDAPTPSLAKVAAIIGKDVAMVAKILHVVNSSFLGLRREITSPSQAVSLLGLETIRLLILAFGIFSSYEASSSSQLSLESLQMHSLETSSLARAIAQTEHADDRTVDHAGIAGLLHDVGILVLLDSGEEAWKVLGEMSTLGERLWEVERIVFGATHGEIGACLLGLWGLPFPVVEAVAWHHHPSESPAATFGALTAVHVANALTSDHAVEGPGVIDFTHLDRLKLSHRLPAWQELAQMQKKKNETL